MHPTEIAETMLRISQSYDVSDFLDVVDVIYMLQTYAQNKYNDEKWRTFYRLLENIAQADRQIRR